MSSANGESSNRPVPTRTMPQPARLTVAQRGATGQVDSSNITDVEALKNDLDRRKLVARKAEKWADKMMEETLSSPIFKKAAAYLSPTQYREVSHERHLNSTCSYPTCSNYPQAPFTTNKRIRISWTNRSINEVEGNAEEGFCSRRCEVRSKWVEDQLEKRGVWERGGKPVELLDEIEPVHPPGDAREETRSKENGKSVVTKRQMPNRAISLGKTIVTPTNPPVQPTLLKQLEQPDLASGATAAFSNLTIHENPTPSVAPLPPSLDAPPPEPKLTSPEGTRRAGSSMISTPSKLTSTLLSASRQMGPMNQMAPDSEGEEEDHDHGESEMGLTWGVEDEEMRDLFEQARMAREMEE